VIEVLSRLIIELSKTRVLAFVSEELKLAPLNGCRGLGGAYNISHDKLISLALFVSWIVLIGVFSLFSLEMHGHGIDRRFRALSSTSSLLLYTI
jgi:hypothetical protein